MDESTIQKMPLPIALALQRAYRESPSAGFQDLVYASEAFLQLVGSMILVDAFDRKAQGVAGRDLLKALDRGRFGVAKMGLWGYCIDQILPRVPDPFSPELHRMREPEPWSAIKPLFHEVLRQRNDVGHPYRRLGELEAEERWGVLAPTLETLVEASTFLSELALVGVVDAEPIPEGSCEVQCVPFVGPDLAPSPIRLVTKWQPRRMEVLLVDSRRDQALRLTPLYHVPSRGADMAVDLSAFCREVRKGGEEPDAPIIRYYQCTHPYRPFVRTLSPDQREVKLITMLEAGIGDADRRQARRVELGLTKASVTTIEGLFDPAASKAGGTVSGGNAPHRGTVLDVVDGAEADTQVEADAPPDTIRDSQLTVDLKGKPVKESPAPSFRPGAVIADRYRIVKWLGGGGMADVYKAIQIGLDRYVAIKVIRPGLEDRDDLRRRFEREAKVLTLLRHPNTIQVLDFGATEQGLLYLVMEFLQGRPLDDVLEREGTLSTGVVREISKQILGSLSEAHGKSVIHRDLKPENVILLDESPTDSLFVKVIDFGIASAALPDDSFHTTLGYLIGTPHYMSPEQADGRAVDERSDIYSLGLNMIQLLTGERVFAELRPLQAAIGHIDEAPLPIPEELVDCPLLPVIRRAVEKSCDARFQSAKEMLVALELDIVPEPGPAPPPPKPITMYLLIAGITTAVALAVMILVSGNLFEEETPSAVTPPPDIMNETPVGDQTEPDEGTGEDATETAARPVDEEPTSSPHEVDPFQTTESDSAEVVAVAPQEDPAEPVEEQEPRDDRHSRRDREPRTSRDRDDSETEETAETAAVQPEAETDGTGEGTAEPQASAEEVETEEEASDGADEPPTSVIERRWSPRVGEGE